MAGLDEDKGLHKNLCKNMQIMLPSATPICLAIKIHEWNLMTVGRQVGEQAEFTMNNQESLQHGNPPSLSSLQQAQRLPLLQVSGPAQMPTVNGTMVLPKRGQSLRLCQRRWQQEATALILLVS